MAVIPILVIEAVGSRVLLALGIAAGAGLAEEAVRKRKKEADEAKEARATPLARAETQDNEKEKCQCPPDKGALTAVAHKMTQAARDYQAHITGFPVGMEWVFEGKDFDGFQSRLCLLQEAKGDYDQFFDEDGEFNYPFQKKIFDRMELVQAKAQSTIVRRNPPASLTWYFQTPVAFDYMQPRLARLAIKSIYAP